MDPDKVEAQVETLELIHAEVTASLAQQSDSGAKIDTKAVVLVGYAGAAATFLATRHGQTQPVLADLAYAAYAVAAGCGIGVFAVTFSTIVPDPRSLFEGYSERSKAATLAGLAATRVLAFESNDSIHKQKARRWWTSLVALALGMTLMLASVIVHTGHHVSARPGTVHAG